MSNEVRARMQEIGHAIEARLPHGYGFIVMCFPFNAPPDTRGEYCSNAPREDVVRMLQEFIDRNPMPDPDKN